MPCASRHFVNDQWLTKFRLPLHKKRFKSNPPLNKNAWQAIIRSKLKIKTQDFTIECYPYKALCL